MIEEQSPRVTKGRKLTLRGKWEIAIIGKQLDNVRRRLISHGQIVTGTSGEDQGRKGQSSCPAPNSKAKPDGKGTTSKTMGNRDEGSSDKRSKIPCRWRNCTNPSCGCWHPPVCQNCKTEIGCNYEYKSIFDTLSLKRGSVRSRRKGVRKDQLLYCRNLYDCIVYLRILIQGSLFHEKEGSENFRWRRCILENFLPLWNFKAEKSTSRMKYVPEQRIFISLCCGSKKLRLHN